MVLKHVKSRLVLYHHGSNISELKINLNFLSMSTAGSYVPHMEWV